MKLLHLTVLSFAALTLKVAPATAEPICYMVDSAGRTRDLTAMCNKSPRESATNNSSQAPANKTAGNGLIQVGKMPDGAAVFYDPKSLTPGTFALQFLSKGIFVEQEYEYACAERRVFASKTTIYKSGLKPVVLTGGGESKFAADSAVSQGLSLACKQSMSPGY